MKTCACGEPTTRSQCGLCSADEGLFTATVKLPELSIRQEQWNRNSTGEIISKAPDFVAYTADQMQEAYVQGLDDCLEIVGRIKGVPLTVNTVLVEVLDAIRALKWKLHETA